MEEHAATPAPAPQPKRKKSGCFKSGCLGCLGIGALLVGSAVIYVLVGLIQGAPEKRPESTELTRVLPRGESALDVPMAPLARDDDVPGDTGGSLVPPAPAARPGRILLDLSMGEFKIVPGEPGQPIRVEADYDAGAYELTETFEPDGETGWTYELTFASKVSMIRHLLGGSDPGRNRVKLIIPRDVPVALSGSVGTGVSHIELGGLWVTDVALRIGVGEHGLSFKEPTREPVEEVFVKGSIGEFALRGLGNASPRRATFTQSIGESRFDLRGSWQRDGAVTLSCGIGECSVKLPRDDDVNIDVDRATLMIGESHTRDLQQRDPAPAGAPTLKLSMSQTIGELRIVD